MAAEASSEAGASVPTARVKSAASTASRSTAGYPHGHLGHLSARQHDALEAFRRVLEETGLWQRGPPPSHDDATLLRFLRARGWLVQEACKQFNNTQDWRAANSIDLLYETIDVDVYEQSRRFYPQWTGRRDRFGMPLYFFDIRNVDAMAVAEYERAGAKTTFSQAKPAGKTAPGLMRMFALCENMMRFTLPLSNQLTDREYPEVPVTMSSCIVDAGAVGLKKFWHLKDLIQSSSQVPTAYYPETLGHIFIIGAPVFFGIIWGWLKRWLDPNTVSKIMVLGPHEVKPTLEAFIDPRNIPRRFGGELDYNFGQLASRDPSWDGVIDWEPGFDSFPTGPLQWEEIDDDKRLACVAHGTAMGEPRRQRICTMAKTWPRPASCDGKGEETTRAADVEATGVSQATQTAEHKTQDEHEGVQTSDAVTNRDAVDRPELSEKQHDETRPAIGAAVHASA